MKTPFAHLSLACAAALVLLLAAAQLTHPHLDPSWRPISEYALGPRGWLMTLAFVSWGVSALALALALALAQEPLARGVKVGLGLLAVGGAGPLLAAVFPMDGLDTPPDQLTVSGLLHAAGAVLGDALAVAAVVLTVALTRSARWAEHRRTLRAAAGVVLFTFLASSAAMAAMMPESGQLGPEVQAGWLLRAYVVATAAWLGAMARSCSRLPRLERQQSELPRGLSSVTP